MDRRNRFVAGGALALMLGAVVTGSGCRSTGNEVPPGPKFPTAGEPPSALGFNQAPHPYNGLGNGVYGNGTMPGSGQPGMSSLGSQASPSIDGLPGGGGGGTGGAPSSFGTPPPSTPGMGQPTNNAFGPPGTSGAYGQGR